jgi:hypothetical protein
MELLFGLFGIIIIIFGLLQIIKLLRQIRILNSMSLKVILKIGEKYGVDIDIQSIQREVEDSL